MEYRHHQQYLQTNASFSRKLSMKHAYDGVFDSPGKLGDNNKVEDYGDIFSGSRKCSIPILDVPELNEGKVNVDVTRSSRVDYTKIFGGFSDDDCGVSFEDLVAKPKKNTRTKGEARVRSGQSGHSVLQKEQVVSSAEEALESFHGVKRFNMSYNKTNPGSENGSNGLTHIAELHAVPGYTCLIDENIASQKTENGKPVVVDDSKLSVNVEELIKRDRTRRKVVSGPQPSLAAENSFRFSADFRKKSSRNMSISNDMSFESFGFGGNNKGVSSRSNFGAVRSDFSVGKPGSCSPPSLEEEVDSNSVAATSAAAVRKAIEEAQLKIKIAKQLMARKREGFHGRAKSSSKNGLKAEEIPEVKAAEKKNGFAATEVREMCEKKDTSRQAFAQMADHNLMKTREAMLHVKGANESPIHINSVEQRHSSKSNSTKEDYIVKVKEVDHRKATGECIEPAIPDELSATQLQYEQVDNEKKMTASAKVSEMDQKIAGEERFQNSEDSGNSSLAFKLVSEVGNVLDLNPSEEAFEGMGRDNFISVQEFPDRQQPKDETQVFPSHTEAEQTHGVSFKHDNREKEVEKFHETNDNSEIEIKLFEGLRESNGTHGWTEIEDIRRKAKNQVEKVEILDAAALDEEYICELDEILGQKENHKVYGELQETVECERMSDVDCREEVEVDACISQEPLESENSSSAYVPEVSETKFNEIPCKDGNENPITGDGLVEGHEELEETKDNENMLQRNCEMNEAEDKQEKNLEGTIGICSEIFQRVVGDENLEAADDVHKQHINENQVSSDKVHVYAVGEANTLLTMGENGMTEAYFATKETVEELEAVETNDLEAEETFEDAELDHDERTEDVSEAIVVGDSWVHLGETDAHSVDSENNAIEYNHEKHVEEMPYYLDENHADVNESMVCPNDEQKEMDFASETEKCLDTDIESTASSNAEEDSKCSSEEEGNNFDVSECKIVNDDDKSSGEEIYEDNKMDEEMSPQSGIFEEKQKNTEMPMGEETIQSSNEEYKFNKIEEGKPENHSRRKAEIVINQNKKSEESREREIEKERERQRMAVERAIREVRERAFAEARERAAAEKAATEAQQRQAEARQRLEKTSAEVKKSASEKAFMEAKLKAERAAVERATAEARERALEKALSVKAASKARNQAEKFSTASREEYKGTGSGSRYSSSSNQDGPISTSRVGEANGESVQRDKARFERHQQTAERAAKALAEKNMRDLLAQKEQAERNRIAEILDAEVKRWSSGKERNLRALLSTLQYILGPDSGWQPIPLTDLISRSSVKKAYRKATLCVHPDKLQQRGATIHQKYTCEKVFDLLKEAWNRFSAEER